MPLTDQRQPAAELTDRSLLRRFRHGSQDAATQLYLRYAERLRRLARAECSPELARRVDVEDIVQSVFNSFFQGASRGWYDVPAGEDLWKLFLVIALHKIRDKGAFHRAARRDVRLTVGAEAIDEHRAGIEADETAETILRIVVDQELERLPPLQREMVTLRIEGHEVAEIATRTGRSKRTVERTLQEFRKRLETLLHQEE